MSGHMACPHRKMGPGVQEVQKTLRSSGLCAWDRDVCFGVGPPS